MPEYADGMISVDNDKDVAITYSVMPKPLALAIADNAANLSLDGQEVKTRAEGAGAALTVKKAEGNAETGKLTVTATAKGFAAGKYYAFALTFADGMSAYQTGFVNVPDGAEDGDVMITATTANGKTTSIILTIADGKINVNTDQLKQEAAE